MFALLSFRYPESLLSSKPLSRQQQKCFLTIYTNISSILLTGLQSSTDKCIELHMYKSAKLYYSAFYTERWLHYAA